MRRKLRLAGFIVGVAFVLVGTLISTGVLGVIILLASVTISLVVTVIGVRRAADFLVQLRWSLPIITFLVTAFVVNLSSDRVGSVRFYELAAQVIPVLLLAIGLESALVTKSRIRDPSEWLIAGLTLAYLAIGEFYALRAVELERGTEDAFAWVVAGLAAGFVAVATLGLLGWSQEADRG